MTTGNLENKIVPLDFWPECFNCAHYYHCSEFSPKHPAFPHLWHWGKETLNLWDQDVMVVTQSWVSTTAMGEPHSGCSDYEINSNFEIPLTQRYQAIIETLQQLTRLTQQLELVESKPNTTIKTLEDLNQQWEILNDRLDALIQGYSTLVEEN